MNPNRSLHKLLRIIFSEVLMEYFDISGWHDDSSKRLSCNSWGINIC